MQELLFDHAPRGAQPKAVRLQSLVQLRWFAIAGQLITLLGAAWAFDLQLKLGLCLLVIGLSAIVNLIAGFVYPATKRLGVREHFGLVLFDVLQLGMLIALTGGLHNPFAILLLAPVITSAAALPIRATVLLGALVLVIITALTQVYLPLKTQQGFILRVADMFIWGNWAAIVIGLLFFSAYLARLTGEIRDMAVALSATQMALAREQKLTDLGGVVAAAAHELGTPLATIKLTSAEMIRDLADRPDLAEDAQLINEQADRCRDILRAMGRAGKEDRQLRSAPLPEVITAAAEPHMDRDKQVHIRLLGNDPHPPTIQRSPEIIHGLRNFVQNAVDFAQSEVWIDANWDEDIIKLRIMDDGPGYPSSVLARLGDPFMARSGPRSRGREGYEGMGLGVFIAKTLLERTGARIEFSNGAGRGRGGAIVQIDWPRARLQAPTGALGENQPLI